MNITDELVARVARTRPVPEGQAQPRLGVAVVACMDSRINPVEIFGLRGGDAHVIRNAGGLVTDDVIRSLAVSQHRLGTRAVMVIQHADCGMQKVTEEEFAEQVAAHAGSAPSWAVGAFRDVEASVRRSVQRLVDCPFLLARDEIRGFVFDESNGDLREVH
ncbi:MAG TPA: carbonic anhydrase [Acidimicrobiales bacterium]|nr:carbonic anhydrase [Acidimicrobiales bacterium]